MAFRDRLKQMEREPPKAFMNGRKRFLTETTDPERTECGRLARRAVLRQEKRFRSHLEPD
jgi:hypothetical protein